MIFTSPRANVTNTTDISICGQTVDKVDSTRFLGVLLDNKLNFRDHITHIRVFAIKQQCYRQNDLILITMYQLHLSSIVSRQACYVPRNNSCVLLLLLTILIYINDMVNVSNLLFYVLFADDSNVFLSGKNVDQIIIQMNVTLIDLVE